MDLEPPKLKSGNQTNKLYTLGRSADPTKGGHREGHRHRLQRAHREDQRGHHHQAVQEAQADREVQAEEAQAAQAGIKVKAVLQITPLKGTMTSSTRQMAQKPWTDQQPSLYKWS